eukprot:TRINITY_DN92232_c0_g1_i1.p1 TRINITY_DN92232_c0_g1~~TRINITY_DN92232_c0_g1_i1.p1  ORF type:complete len:157 (-),score=15.57 TRINITY_DN92232_c0_g1_i1:114-560(-)
MATAVMAVRRSRRRSAGVWSLLLAAASLCLLLRSGTRVVRSFCPVPQTRTAGPVAHHVLPWAALTGSLPATARVVGVAADKPAGSEPVMALPTGGMWEEMAKAWDTGANFPPSFFGLLAILILGGVAVATAFILDFFEDQYIPGMDGK